MLQEKVDPINGMSHYHPVITRLVSERGSLHEFHQLTANQQTDEQRSSRDARKPERRLKRATGHWRAVVLCNLLD